MHVRRERLANQFLTGQPLASPVEVVRRLGCVQAQDYTGAKWAIAQRTRGASDADVEGAIARGDILRTHVLRPTWHFVLPADIRWMLALTGPRVAMAMTSYNRKLGLTAAVFRRTNAAIARALRDGDHLTRAELRDRFAAARLGPFEGQVLGHVMMQAELDGVVCSGARRGKQQTYALLDLRAPALAPIDRDDALARLATIYFTTRGPATAQDFAWWSGLTVTDARRAIEILGGALAEVTLGETRMWTVERGITAPVPGRVAHLLPNYDEYFIGFRDRSAIGGRAGTGLVTGGSALVGHVATIAGEIVGTWRAVRERGITTATVEPVVRLTGAERDALAVAEGRFRDFAAGRGSPG